MYNKVVVPLDGSDLAELALAHVAEIAGGCKVAEIYLVSATEKMKGRVSGAWIAETTTREIHMPPDNSPFLIGTSFSGALYSSDATRLKEIPSDMGRMAKTALDYLSKKSAELEQKGLHAEVRVLIGSPAEEIIHFAKQEQADLIIMATSSKAGFGRWDTAGIADKVTKTTDIPVLLVKPKPDFKETKPHRQGVAS